MLLRVIINHVQNYKCVKMLEKYVKNTHYYSTVSLGAITCE